jgi:translation initiation factor 5B
VVALTKVDALPGWKKCEGESFSNSLKQQRQDVQLLLDEKLYQIVGEVYKHGFSSERFDRVSDFTKQVCAIPVSAVSGEGLPELLLFLSGLAQKFLEGELDSGENKSGKASILEVKEEKGLGMTLDCVLYYGSLKRGDSIAFSTINGVAESKVKALLEPKPLQEMRDPKQKFSSVEEAFSARGVKVSCEFAGDAVAGSSLLAWRSEGEKESSVSLLESEMKEIVFAKDAKGAIVCADALGSLEAIERLFSAEGIPVSKAAIGKVQKKEILEAKAIAETSKELGVVFAFNTKMEDGVEEEAKKLGVKIFSENVIYYLIDNYKKWVFEERNRERSEAFSRICLAKITALPNCCFRLSNPCIIGVEVLEGTLKKECDLMNAQGDKLGTVRAIQREKKEVEEAKRGEQVAISIEGSVCFGRQLKEKETLYSMITKEDYNLLKKRYMQALGEGERELLEEIAALRGLRISL